MPEEEKKKGKKKSVLFIVIKTTGSFTAVDVSSERWRIKVFPPKKEWVLLYNYDAAYIMFSYLLMLG